MSSTEAELIAKLQAEHRARVDELSSSCEAQRSCTQRRLAEVRRTANLPVVVPPDDVDS